MCTKVWCTCRVVLLIKPTTFLPFSLPSPSSSLSSLLEWSLHLKTRNRFTCNDIIVSFYTVWVALEANTDVIRTSYLENFPNKSLRRWFSPTNKLVTSNFWVINFFFNFCSACVLWLFGTKKLGWPSGPAPCYSPDICNMSNILIKKTVTKKNKK